MLNILRRGQAACQLETLAPGWTLDDDVIWIDLLKPTREEELEVEAALQLELPTAEEMKALEPSSRLYQEGGATFMTATALAHGDDPAPFTTAITFVLAGDRLVTLRYEALKAFSVFQARVPAAGLPSGAAVLLNLQDAIVERLAQVLDATGDRVEAASVAIFQRPAAGDFRPMLTNLAQAQSVTAITRNCLVSLGRVGSFATLAPEINGDAEHRAHLESLQRDVQSLTDHADHQSNHVAFLLDAALGLINIEQNGIIKFFSVVAVVFMPPTLIASIYGMNFDVLPELHWPAGYPVALVAMLIAAILPVLWFKRRGWL